MEVFKHGLTSTALLLVQGSLTTKPVSPALASQTVGPPSDKACYLFEHREIQRAQLTLRDGNRVSMADEDVGATNWRLAPNCNDEVTSIRAPGTCTLTVWEHASARDRSQSCSGQRSNFIGDFWNERASSARCVC